MSKDPKVGRHHLEVLYVHGSFLLRHALLGRAPFPVQIGGVMGSHMQQQFQTILRAAARETSCSYTKMLDY